jgi:hypothetical protein
MFERYTEKARRAVFFARYEASRYGSPTIESEHLLLGLLREENSHLHQWIPNVQPDTIRQWIDKQVPHRTTIPTNVDLPLSNDSKKILNTAADVAAKLRHRHIGTEHLFLALCSIGDSVAAKVLVRAGTDPLKIGSKLAQQPEEEGGTFADEVARRLRARPPSSEEVEIHGTKRNADYIRDVVSTVRAHNWHWQKAAWKPRDLVFHRKTGQFSFDTSLAEDAKHFILVEKGWKKDRCFICGWELFESEDEHGIGYTNGRAWLCVECCERFIHRDYFSSSHSEMT